MLKTNIQSKKKSSLDIQKEIEQVNKKYWQKYYSKIRDLEKTKNWKDLATLLQEIRNLKKEIDNFEIKIKNELQEIFQKENKQVLEDMELRVIGKLQKRSYFDVKTFKKEKPKLYKKYKKETSNFVIRITKK